MYLYVIRRNLNLSIFTRLSLIFVRQDLERNCTFSWHACAFPLTRVAPPSTTLLSWAFSSPYKTLLPFSTISPHPAHSFHVHRPMALSLTLALIMKCVVCCCSMRTERAATGQKLKDSYCSSGKPGSGLTGSPRLVVGFFFLISLSLRTTTKKR